MHPFDKLAELSDYLGSGIGLVVYCETEFHGSRISMLSPNSNESYIDRSITAQHICALSSDTAVKQGGIVLATNRGHLGRPGPRFYGRYSHKVVAEDVYMEISVITRPKWRPTESSGRFTLQSKYGLRLTVAELQLQIGCWLRLRRVKIVQV